MQVRLQANVVPARAIVRATAVVRKLSWTILMDLMLEGVSGLQHPGKREGEGVLRADVLLSSVGVKGLAVGVDCCRDG